MTTRRPVSEPYVEGANAKPTLPVSERQDAIEKVAWPSEGIQLNTARDDYTWGYLYFLKTGPAEFDDSITPAESEIMDRWGHYLS